MDVLSSSSKLYHHAGGERGKTEDNSTADTASQLRLTNDDFLRLVRKALLGDYMLAVLQIFYAIWVGNFFHHILVSCWIVQFWFVSLIWCVALPLVQQNEDERQQQHAVLFWSFLPMLLVLSAGALLRTNYTGQNLEFVMGGIVCYVASAIVAVIICLALREIRNTIAKVYAGDTLTIRAKALQFTRDTIKVGFIQMCLFTIAMMGIGFTTEKELISTMMRRQYAGGGGNGNPDQMIEDQELVGLVLQGYKAGLVGFVLNIFLIQSIVSNHILNKAAPTLVDLLSGNYLWLEFGSVLLQMILVVSITLIVATIAPSDFVPFSNIDTTFLQSRLLQLIMLGIFLPAFLLLLLIIYFCRAYGDESSSSGQFLRQRHQKKIQLGGGAGGAYNPKAKHSSSIIAGSMPFDDHGFDYSDSDFSDKLDYSQSATSSTQQELEQEPQMLELYKAELERSNGGRSMHMMSSSSTVLRGSAAVGGTTTASTSKRQTRPTNNKYCSPDAVMINVI